MAAKTSDQVIKGPVNDFGSYVAFPVASSETIYKGVINFVNNAGYLQNAASALADNARIAAISIDSQASSTTAGSISGDTESGINVARCYTQGVFKLHGTGFAQSDVGKVAYAHNNWDVSIDPTAGKAIGTIVKYISATTVYVDLNAYYKNDGLIMYQGALIAGTTTTGGDVVNWANPTGEVIMIENLILDVTTPATGVATADAGIAATGTSDDTLIDGVDIGTAAIVATGIGNAGTNGGTFRKCAAAEYVTVTPSATAAGLVGTFTVLYRIWE